MSVWSRIANVICRERLSREIDEEFESHIQEAIEQGRDPAEARRAFGSPLGHREESRDIRLIGWLDALRADAVFGWRQLVKNKVTSAAAVLSLGLTLGACTSAFRLIDALLLRPLPVAEPERLYVLSRQITDGNGKPQQLDAWSYPAFRLMRMAVKDQAGMIAASDADLVDLTYRPDQEQEMEEAHRQCVSGGMFSSFGLQPTLGRLLTESDDLRPRAHPYAVLSYDYWTRRFGKDPKVIGRSFRLGNDLYEIVGVGPERFTGTQPGTVTDIFLPTMMYSSSIDSPHLVWLRIFARLKPRAAAAPVRERLRAALRAVPDPHVNGTLLLEPAAAGVSGMQKNYRLPLAALSVLVGLVLLIACANVANLMTAQATARAREMALRVSIGAGQWRLVQLVLVESSWLAFLSAALGGLFAWQAAPFVVGMINPPNNPARLYLPADWRVLGFGLVLTVGVTFLFGLAPALRASTVRPVSALKGGEGPSGLHVMRALIGIQVAFCFLVLFVGGLFVSTFDRLAYQPTGFSAERLLTLDTVAAYPQTPAVWDQVVEHLRGVPGVETVALARWPLLSGIGWIGYISINGVLPSQDFAYFLDISPGWLDAMRIPFIDGRDFLPSDTYPGAAIVNQAFAKRYFNGENPIGKLVERADPNFARIRMQVVGLVRDARYLRMREAIRPTVYVPFYSADAKGTLNATGGATLIVRTSSPNPLTLALTLRREVSRARPEFRVRNIRPQKEINESHTIRERLLAVLALFFAGVALLLAGIGLYGVLDYSVLQRQREIGIRRAVGAQAGDIAWRVTVNGFCMVLVGALAGAALGMASVRYMESLLYQVKATDLQMLALPSLAIVVASLVAALPGVIRAVRIDPVIMLRSE